LLLNSWLATTPPEPWNNIVLNLRRSTLIVLSQLLLGSFFVAGSASAHDYRVGSLHIDHPWSVATPKGAQVGVGYMKITNEGIQADRLIGITSPGARKAAIHDMVHEGDVMRMRQLDNGVEIKPGETVEFAPQGKHVMFEELAAPLAKGDRLKSTLDFEKAGSIDVEFAVAPLGTKMPGAMPMHNH
jgi:copper(I)-binding protein